MKILFTGSSSFTGYWFLRKLALAHHEVHAVFTRPSPDDYDGLRKKRIELLPDNVHQHYNCRFGDETFMEIIQHQGPWDLMCHHAANVTNYKESSFDICSALYDNTRNVAEVIKSLCENGNPFIVLTGSYFEQNEGEGDDIREAFSPYGLSKGLTWQVFKYWCNALNGRLAKFVIPNPFGPYEEPRFAAYLVRNWIQGKTPTVNTPLYIRDNIPVTLLSGVYEKFVTELTDGRKNRYNPSGYIESQGDFAKRMSGEFSSRWNMSCHVILNQQTDFSEPLSRYNTDDAWQKDILYNEKDFWDEYALYYSANLNSQRD